jgi:predicted DNA-binding transcriptional regulator AlpA
MGRPSAISKPLRTSIEFFEKHKNGMTVRDIEIITGWSRATVRRRMQDGEFPQPLRKRGKQLSYDHYELVEWLSRYNLRVILGDDFLEYERTLQARAFADPRLGQARWRIIDRENIRRSRQRDAAYVEMPLRSN